MGGLKIDHKSQSFDFFGEGPKNSHRVGGGGACHRALDSCSFKEPGSDTPSAPLGETGAADLNGSDLPADPHISNIKKYQIRS